MEMINDKSAFMFHKMLEQKDHNNINKLLSMLSIDTIIKSKHNGFISNMLYHMIDIDSKELEHIYKVLDNTDLLMKRDYLNMILYYYNKDINYAISIFSNKIITKNLILLSKDIDFILDNNMFDLLPLLNEVFICTSINTLPYTTNYNNLELKYLNKIDCDTILQNIIISDIKYNFDISNVKTIIDGCNIIHSRTGKITHNSLEDLKIVIEMATIKFGKPLVVIHKRHLKTLPKLMETLKILNVPYILTPPGYDDDLYILYFFLMLKSKVFIISNDKYRDHIFKYNNINQKAKNIITQMTVGYKNSQNILIDDIPMYSQCIQHIGNSIYIPHISGNFIKIN